MHNKKLQMAVAALGLILGLVAAGTSQADSFGTTGNEFTIDFVDIGDAGNAPNGSFGTVVYNFRMGKYEIPQGAIDNATASGMANVTADAWGPSRSAADITWFEAAAFANWLNETTGHQKAYDLTWNGSEWTMNLWSSEQAWQVGGENLYRHKNAYYFLPGENEWYKAAYYNSAGSNYFAYGTGSDTVPISTSGSTLANRAVYDGGMMGTTPAQPAAVNNAGGLSAYGTMGQSGNVWEWTESMDGSADDPNKNRMVRGGGWSTDNTYALSSGFRLTGTRPTDQNDTLGFRIASAESPTIAVMGDFYLRNVDGQMQVCWQTLSEEDSVGFDLFRWNGNGWEKVNAELIPATGEMGGSYYVNDPTANTTNLFRYKLVEYETDGGIQEYGPFDRAVWHPRLENLAITPDGVVLRWLSREQDTYEVQKSFGTGNGYETLATSLPATPPVNVYTDQMGTVNASFYRVQVKE